MTLRWTWDIDPGKDPVDEGILRGLRARIDDVLGKREQGYIGLLGDLVRFPTISGSKDREGQEGFRAAMEACLARVEAEARRLGLEWRCHEGMAAFAQWPGRRGQYGSVGVAAHLDVVPAVGMWHRPPFEPDGVEGEVWGRGTQDDKVGVVMGLAAIDVLQRLGLRPKSDVRLLLGTLEETDDWGDMDLLLEREAAPDLTLVPDGAFPVVVGEKGLLTHEWQANWEPVSVDGLRLVGLRSGERHNVVPERGRFQVACAREMEDELRKRLHAHPLAAHVHPVKDPPPAARGDACLEVTTEGRAAHGAFPDRGHNAALDALRIIAELFADKGPGAFARFLVETCGSSDGAGLDLDHEHTRMGKTTVNLGVVEAGEAHGHARISTRFPLGLRLESVEDRFKQAAQRAREGLRVEYSTRGRPHEALFVSPEDHPRTIRALQSAYRAGTGREPTLASIAGTTYAKILPLAVAFGPQDESAGEQILAHQPDERVSVERLLENIRVYALALALLACDRDELDALVQGDGTANG